MNEVKDQFEKLEVSESSDSFNSVYRLLKHSVTFFSTKQNTDNRGKSSARSKQAIGYINKRKMTLHNSRQSKERDLASSKEEIIPCKNNQSKQENKVKHHEVYIDKNNYFTDHLIHENKKAKDQYIRTENNKHKAKNHENTKLFKLSERRINPKWAQENIEVSKDKNNKQYNIPLNVVSKEVDKSIIAQHIPKLNIKKMQNIRNRESNPFQVVKNENDCSIFDSSRKSESEHEQELNVKPERISFGNVFSDSESEGNGLRLDLKQWEYTSNSSNAMTPRMNKEGNNKWEEDTVIDQFYNSKLTILI